MLGTLSRLLRIIGIDTAYAPADWSDDRVLRCCDDQQRALVTRDYDLSRRASAQGIETALVRDLAPEHLLLLVQSHFGFALDPDLFYSRCTDCNGNLEPVDAADVSDQVPAGVIQRHTRFTRCVECSHVYWPGTHVESLDARLRDLVAAAHTTDGPKP